MSETSYTPTDYNDKVGRVGLYTIPPDSDIASVPIYPRVDKDAVLSWSFEGAEALYVNGDIRHQVGHIDFVSDQDKEFDFLALTSDDRYPETHTVKTIKPYFEISWPGLSGVIFAFSYNSAKRILSGSGSVAYSYTPPTSWVIEPYSMVIDDDYAWFVISSANTFRVVKLDLADMTELLSTGDTNFTPASYEPRIGVHNDGTNLHLFYRENNVLTYKSLVAGTLVDRDIDYAVDTISPVVYERLFYVTEGWIGYYDGTDTTLYHDSTTTVLTGERISGIHTDGWFFTDHKVYLYDQEVFVSAKDIWGINIWKDAWMVVSTVDDTSSPDMCSLLRFEIDTPANTEAIADTPVTGLGVDERFFGTMGVSGAIILAGIFTSNGRMVVVKYDGQEYSSGGITL